MATIGRDTAAGPNPHGLLAYVAALELEVDRLRKQERFLRKELRGAARRMRRLCADAADPAMMASQVRRTVGRLAGVVRDLHDPIPPHTTQDRVSAVAVRPLAEQVFRALRRLEGAPRVELRLELQAEQVDWFPARLRHVLDNLFSHALKARDGRKEASWVLLAVHELPGGYELRLSDNGVGLAPEAPRRAGIARDAGPGVGLAVVRLLVEQSGGTLEVTSGEGQGSTFVAFLPRYSIDDFLLA